MYIFEKIPYFISYFFGYRKPDYKPKRLPAYRIYLWSFIGAWIGIALLEIIFAYGSSFKSHHSPMIVASFGASAVLLYGAIDAPLAQPRNVFCGQVIGAIVGVIISQLFLNINQNWATQVQYVAVQWVSGATAMALALVIMQITKTVHPPGGATALIPSVTPAILDIQWFYIGIVALSSAIQIAVACLVNNIERHYPQYWWTPKKLPLQIDPATLSTVLSTHGTTMNQEEDVVMSNLTDVEEGRLSSKIRYVNNSSPSVTLHLERRNNKQISTVRPHNSRRSSSSTTINNEHSITVEQAIHVLQANVHQHHLLLFCPGSPLIITPGLLSDQDIAQLESILNKLL